MHLFSEETLQLFWIVPAVAVLFFVTQRRKLGWSRAFADDPTFTKISTDFSFSKDRLRKLLMLAAIGLVIFALARPQWGTVPRVFKRKGVDIIFAVDTSLSMRAEDVKPSRIKAVKRSILRFLERLKGDRVGLVSFAGSGYLQVPLTIDHAAFRLFLDALDVGLIPDPGSSLAEAVRASVQAFKETDKPYRVIILYSDGEDHMAVPDELMKVALSSKARVYSVGVGTKDGAPIPLRSETGELGGYKKDRRGETVISKLNGDLISKLAQETGGLYYPITASGKEAQLIYDDIQVIEKRELGEHRVAEREDRYQIFLALGMVLLALETTLGERKKK